VSLAWGAACAGRLGDRDRKKGGAVIVPSSPVLSIAHIPIEPLTVDQHPTKPDWWKAQGHFRVRVQLAPGRPDIGDFEYRQYIKGTAMKKAGIWVNGVWFPIGQQESMATYFKIPPDSKVHATGLINHWKEDGINDNGVVRRYGYRNAPMSDGGRLFDRYFGNPATATEYLAEDFPGIEGQMVDGLRLEFYLRFVGAVINVKTRDTYDFKDWTMATTRTIRRTSFGTWSISAS
jgi:hypothetical protein